MIVVFADISAKCRFIGAGLDAMKYLPGFCCSKL
jgi:hypothetical protein